MSRRRKGYQNEKRGTPEDAPPPIKIIDCRIINLPYYLAIMIVTRFCVFSKRLHTCTLRFFCNALRRYIIFLCQHPNHSCCSLGSDAVVDDVIACTLVSIAGYYNLCLCVLVREVNLLFPQISEIIGGSVREESYDKLMGEIEARNIPMKDMNWYLDTRKYGSCPHAGFYKSL